MSKRFRITHIVVTFLPTIWFPFVVAWLGQLLGIVSADRHLTVFGWISSVIVIILVLIFQLLHYIYSNVPSYKSLEEYNKILVRVEDSLCMLCCAQEASYVDLVENNAENLSYDLLYGVHDPLKSINEILHELQNYFVNKMGVRRDQVSVTFAYSFLGEDKWQWSDSNISNDTSLIELCQNRKTAFYQIYSKKKSIVFRLDKKEAVVKGEYCYNEKDEAYKFVGTIICIRVACRKHKKDYVSGILTISTYGECLLADIVPDNPAKDFVKQHVLSPFCVRLDTEMAVLYAKHVIEANLLRNKERADLMPASCTVVETPIL